MLATLERAPRPRRAHRGRGTGKRKCGRARCRPSSKAAWRNGSRRRRRRTPVSTRKWRRSESRQMEALSRDLAAERERSAVLDAHRQETLQRELAAQARAQARRFATTLLSELASPALEDASGAGVPRTVFRTARG
ncbi:MAG: hypothetical protein MZW92_46940 [Comamonadaceae bacterium]|nr:hypothetical protein [Comamonadaceae bacterium]